MTDRIVDSDLNVSDGTSTEEISSQLEGEKVTSANLGSLMDGAHE